MTASGEHADPHRRPGGFAELASMPAQVQAPRPDAGGPPPQAAPALAPTSAADTGTDVRTLHRTAPRSRAATGATDATDAAAAPVSAARAATAIEARELVASASRFTRPEPDARIGTVYGRGRPGVDLPAGRSGRLNRLHIGWHSASVVALSMIGVAGPGTGMILGEDVDRHAVTIRCFRPEPTLLTLVGGVWAAQVITFRALAVGALVLVCTDEPAGWHDFASRSGAARGQLMVTTDAPRSAGNGDGPTLIVHDLRGPRSTPDLGPWQTQLTVLRHLDEPGVTAIHEAHLVLAQRLDLSEAMLAVTSMRLTSDSALLLQQLEPDMVAAIGSGTTQYVWWAGTEAENRLIGPPRR